MPTYEYECRSCQHRFEKFQSITEDPVKICPVCGGSVRRVIGGGMGVIFKGPGFYITDSRHSSAASSIGGAKKEEGPREAQQSAPAEKAAEGAAASSSSPSTKKESA